GAGARARRDHRPASLRAARRAVRRSGARPDPPLRARARIGAGRGARLFARAASRPPGRTRGGSVRMAPTSGLNEGRLAERRRADWELLEAIVARAEGKGIGALPVDDVARLPGLYRDVCADLSRAQAARYGAPLVDELQNLVASAHAVLYRAQIR